jgi:hypothetical protein
MELTTQVTGEVVDPSDPHSIVESLLPYYSNDTTKNRYLSFRAAGFTVNESIALAVTSYRSVMRWRADDPEFKRLDTEDIGHLRDSVGANYLRMEFTRNFRLVLEKDRRILDKAMSGTPLPKEDQQYLRAIRSQYTPAALASLETVISGEDEESEKFDLRSLVLRMTQNGHQAELSIQAVE